MSVLSCNRPCPPHAGASLVVSIRSAISRYGLCGSWVVVQHPGPDAWTGGTRHRPLRAEHTAIAWLRPKQCLARGAFVEELTDIRRHNLGLDCLTNRAGDGGFYNHRIVTEIAAGRLSTGPTNSRHSQLVPERVWFVSISAPALKCSAVAGRQ